MMVAVRSVAASQSDAFIQLVKRGLPIMPVLGGKVVQRPFTRHVDLFFSFATSPLVAPFFKSDLNAKAKEFIPRNTILAHLAKNDKLKTARENASNSESPRNPTKVENAKDQERTQHIPPQQDEKENDHLSLDPETQDEGSTDLLPTEISNEDETLADSLPDRPFTEAIDESKIKEEYSEKEHLAASKVQRAYRRHRRRTSRVANRPVDQWFEDFSDAAKKMNLSGRYIALLRGPLAHFMVCLDAFKADNQKQRSKAMKVLAGKDHRSIEDTMARLNAIK
jgi:hypothetical protein